MKFSKEELVFEFWNSFKGRKTFTKLDSKTGASIHWHSHNKLTHDMILAIKENLKNYTLEELCMGIDNYAKVLLGDDYFWTHVWPLSTFFTVKHEKRKDGSKKWWQFLPENFSLQLYLKRGNTAEENLVEDSDPELTNMIISSLKRWGLVRKEFTPNSKQTNQLRLTSQKILDFYEDRTCQDEKIWLEDLFDCLNFNYLGKGDTVSIGLLCSDYLWDILMPQLLRSCKDV